ncbi:MAG TPA: tetratricopeptide repeat protein [Pyrinomonadaceae bacterium]|nr:tetratricopeptide repeat protein [Pyrinomonadaceae bacterium]
MYRVFGLIVLVVAAAFFAACSGAQPTAQNANVTADPTPLANAADYTDANTALADGVRVLENGETERAIEILNRAVEINPDLAEAYFRLGIAHSLIEFRDQMAAEDRVEPTETPANSKEKPAKPQSVLAFEKAVDAYKKLIDANGEDHNAYYNLGRSYNKLNEDEDAARALRQAVKLNPDDTEYQQELGAVLIKLAKYSEAVGVLKKSIELDADNIEALELLEKAEAGQKRISFTVMPGDDKRNANSNANAAANTATGSNTKPPANTAKPPEPRPSRPPQAPPPAANRPRSN